MGCFSSHVLAYLFSSRLFIFYIACQLLIGHLKIASYLSHPWDSQNHWYFPYSLCFFSLYSKLSRLPLSSSSYLHQSIPKKSHKSILASTIYPCKTQISEKYHNPLIENSLKHSYLQPFNPNFPITSTKLQPTFIYSTKKPHISQQYLLNIQIFNWKPQISQQDSNNIQQIWIYPFCLPKNMNNIHQIFTMFT